MEYTTKNKYMKRLYASEFILSSALGMIPLMTVLSFLMSSMSESTFYYALILALYNICTTLPKIYVANNMSNKKNTFSYLFSLRVIQIILWMCMSLIFVIFDGSMKYVFLFCLFYLAYAVVKGSVDVLNIDIYSKVIPRSNIGKFFGLKYSLNSFAEFSGALLLASIFKFLDIDTNYALIFLIVGVLDFISLIVLYLARVHINWVPAVTEDEVINKVDNCPIENKTLIVKIKNFVKRSNFYNNIIKANEIISTDPVFLSFLKANIVSIVGASVASFFIPYGVSVLGLTMANITFTNVLWLISKMLSSVVWGYVADTIGTKFVMIGSRVSLLCSYILAISLKSVNIFYLIIILHGFSSSALVIMAQNIFIEISGNKGALYAAINSFVCMPFFVIMPLVSSFLSENIGYVYSFLLSSIPLIISIIMMFRVKISKNKESNM